VKGPCGRSGRGKPRPYMLRQQKGVDDDAGVAALEPAVGGDGAAAGAVGADEGRARRRGEMSEAPWFQLSGYRTTQASGLRGRDFPQRVF